MHLHLGRVWAWVHFPWALPRGQFFVQKTVGACSGWGKLGWGVCRHAHLCLPFGIPTRKLAVYKGLAGVSRHRALHIHGCWGNKSISTLWPCSLGTYLSMWEKMIQEQLPEYANAKLCSGNARRAPGTERALKVILQTSSRGKLGSAWGPWAQASPFRSSHNPCVSWEFLQILPRHGSPAGPSGKPLSKAARVSECQNSGHDWARCNSIQDQGLGVFQNQSLS